MDIMKSSFELKSRDKANYLIYLGSRRPPSTEHGSGQGFIKSLAWPVYAWQVIAPKPFDNESNPLQRAVLRLIRSGLVSQTDIADKLSIQPRLARQVILQSISYGSVETSGDKLTPQGLALIGEGQEPDFCANDCIDGWIFRDALTGDIVPYFHEGALVKASGARAMDSSALPICREFQSQPKPETVMDAIRVYSRLIRSGNVDDDNIRDIMTIQGLSEGAWRDGEDSPDDKKGHNPRTPGFVRMIGARPELVDIEVLFNIRCCDHEEWQLQPMIKGNRSGYLPCGWWFQKRLSWGISHNEDLAKTISSWTREAGVMFLPIISISVEDKLAELYPALLANPELAETAKVMRQLLQFDSFISGGDGLQDNPVPYMALLNLYQNLLETLFNACIQKLPSGNRPKICLAARRKPNRKKDPQRYSHWKNDIAGGIKLKDLPDSLLNTRWAYDKFEFQSIRDRAGFLIMHARMGADSPFIKAMRLHEEESHSLLYDIDRAAEFRNKYSLAHVDDANSQITIDERKRFGDDMKTCTTRIMKTMTAAFFGEDV